MRVSNVDSRDNNASYEVLVVCKDAKEEQAIWTLLLSKGFILDGMEELEISVYANVLDYGCKTDFLKDIRKIIKSI